MNRLALIFLTVVSASLYAQTQETYRERASKNLPFLIKDNAIADQVVLDNNGVHIYEKGKKHDAKAEFFLGWAECPFFVDKLENLDFHSIQKFYREKGLNRLSISTDADVNGFFNKYTYKYIPYKQYPNEIKDLYIAIDPGHYAGTWDEAIAEDRYVKVRGVDVGVEKDQQFFEGDLAWTEAYIYAKQLRALGASVKISREYGKSALGYTFEEWYVKRFKKDLDSCLATGDVKKEEYHFLRTATKQDVHDRFFKFLDFRARSRVINEFMPHITFILHLNADEQNKRDNEGYLKPVEDNFNMAFIPGAFVNGELTKTDAKLDFIRLLLSTDYDNSARLANHVLKAHESILKVGTLPKENKLSYLSKVCQPTEYPGVYARNLYLARSIRGPVVYLESLLQDNKSEILSLSKKDLKVDHIMTSSRIGEIVKANMLGLTTFLEENKKLQERLFSTAN